MQRRSFLLFLGRGMVATSLLPPFISACNLKQSKRLPGQVGPITSISPSDVDELILAEGLDYSIIAQYGDPISTKDTFGYNNDYLAFLPSDTENEGLLWVNHEYVNPMFVSGYVNGPKTKAQADREMYNIGGTLMRIRKEGSQWSIVKDDLMNKRYHAKSMIPFQWDTPIFGKKEAMGTFQNCAGGITPWGTILTCEENYQTCYGERNFKTGEIVLDERGYGWGDFYDNPPEHYGWVVEINPQSGSAEKIVALGRCAHECATVVELPDKRVVVYTGDDKNDQCVYKFISNKPASLQDGTLYVANLELGKWIPVSYEEQAILRENFSSQTEVLIRLREAAKLLGGTQLARPEDIEVDPVTGHILIALTNNIPKKNYHGEILKIKEDNNRYDSLNFSPETFLTGGEESGFACPDNLAFDRAGNLWFTSDISGSLMNKPPYKSFKNNGLFLVPRSGKQAGKVLQIASAPKDAELTGPFFTPDGKTLFLSVQHPGERSKALDQLSSHWPNGGNEIPKPAVVCISGPLLDAVQGLS